MHSEVVTPCHGLVDLFYSLEPSDIDQAKAICKDCPFIEPCLDLAMDTQEPAGIWGGQILSYGNIILERNGGVGRGARRVSQLPVPQKWKHRVRIWKIRPSKPKTKRS